MASMSWKPKITWKPKNYLPWIGLGVGLVLIAVAGIPYQHLTRRPTQPTSESAANRGHAGESISALGRLEPAGEVIQVFSPTALEGARVEALQVSLGQQIRQGDVIAVLETHALRRAALKEVEEQVKVTVSRLQQVEAGAKLGQIQAQAEIVDRQRVDLETQTRAQEATIARLVAELRNAELEFQRYQSLYGEGAISASLRDSKQLTADTMRQQLQEARADLSRIQRSGQKQVSEAQATLAQIAEVRPVDVNLARSQVAQAQASVARARADLDLTVVRSPQDGQVLKIHTRPGEIVGSQGIISLGQTQQMVAVAEVYELDISRVKVGQAATVISKNKAFPDTLGGKVMEVGLEIGKKDVLNTDPAAQFDARVVEVKVLLDPFSSRKVAGLTNLSVQVAIAVNEQP